MDLTSQTPAEGISLRSDYGNAKSYVVPCTCCASDCEHNVWVETDDHYLVTVTVYTKQKTKWWEMNRFKTIWRLLTKGYVEYEGSILMSKQQAFNYANTLNQAIADVEQFQKDGKKPR